MAELDYLLYPLLTPAVNDTAPEQRLLPEEKALVDLVEKGRFTLQFNAILDAEFGSGESDQLMDQQSLAAENEFQPSLADTLAEGESLAQAEFYHADPVAFENEWIAAKEEPSLSQDEAFGEHRRAAALEIPLAFETVLSPLEALIEKVELIDSVPLQPDESLPVAETETLNPEIERAIADILAQHPGANREQVIADLMAFRFI